VVSECGAQVNAIRPQPQQVGLPERTKATTPCHGRTIGRVLGCCMSASCPVPGPGPGPALSIQPPITPTEKPPFSGGFSSSPPRGDRSFTWHRAIFAGGYPPTIVAAAAFHNRVRDGSVWFHSAMDTRIGPPLTTTVPCVVIQGLNPENCIG
jgi:hypothetical protein